MGGRSVISHCQQVQANSSSLHGQLDGSWFFTNWWLSKSFSFIKVIHNVPQTGATGPSFPKTGDKWKVKMRTIHKEDTEVKTKGLNRFSHLKLVLKGILPPPFGFVLPSLCCSYSLLQVFRNDTQFHEMVSHFIQFPTTLKLGMK
jgi:hypothetical protein